MKSHVVIYIPGLGDKNLATRRKLLKTWHYNQLDVEICSMDWSMVEPWHEKFAVLMTRITELSNSGKIVSLVGESAGAGAAILALRAAPEKIQSVVLLCGKFEHPDRVAEWRFQQNPAFREALNLSHLEIGKLTNDDRKKLLSLHPIFDPTVPVKETKISGVKNSTLPIIGHATGIAFATTIWSWRIVRFARHIK